MKIGVLTYNRVINSGAVLQAYSVVKLLESTFPEADVEIIDIVSFPVLFKEWRKTFSLRKIKFNNAFINKKKACRSFFKNIKKSKFKLNLNDKKTMKWLNKQKFDLVVVGSDTVWEIRDPGYAPRGLNVYFLPGKTTFKKVGFCVSSDPITKLSNYQKKEMLERSHHASLFDAVIFRDEPTKNLFELYKFHNNRVLLSPDPVLLNGLKNFKKNFYDFKKINKSEAIFASSLGREEESNLVMNLAKNLNLNFVDLTNKSSNKESHLSEYKLNSIEEMVSFHSYFKILITDRFHASIFTLLLSDSLIFFYEDPLKWPLANSKGRDLFNSIGKSDFVLRDLNILNEESFLEESAEKWKDSLSELKIKLNLFNTDIKRKVQQLLREVVNEK